MTIAGSTVYAAELRASGHCEETWADGRHHPVSALGGLGHTWGQVRTRWPTCTDRAHFLLSASSQNFISAAISTIV